MRLVFYIKYVPFSSFSLSLSLHILSPLLCEFVALCSLCDCQVLWICRTSWYWVTKNSATKVRFTADIHVVSCILSYLVLSYQLHPVIPGPILPAASCHTLSYLTSCNLSYLVLIQLQYFKMICIMYTHYRNSNLNFNHWSKICCKTVIFLKLQKHFSKQYAFT